MKLTESYTDTQLSVLEKLRTIGVDLDIASFYPDNYTDNIYQLSLQGAIEGMKVFAKRWNKRLEKIDRKAFPAFKPEKAFRIQINPTILPQGTEISINEFLGIDIIKETIKTIDLDKINSNSGLLYALFCQPHGLWIPEGQTHSHIFNSFVYGLLNITQQNTGQIIIYKWSDDWSNYFDAGKEWWGTFYWTVYNKETNNLLVIGASTTD